MNTNLGLDLIPFILSGQTPNLRQKPESYGATKSINFSAQAAVPS